MKAYAGLMYSTSLCCATLSFGSGSAVSLKLAVCAEKLGPKTADWLLIGTNLILIALAQSLDWCLWRAVRGLLTSVGCFVSGAGNTWHKPDSHRLGTES